jgi:hypothetical protein
MRMRVIAIAICLVVVAAIVVALAVIGGGPPRGGQTTAPDIQAEHIPAAPPSNAGRSTGAEPAPDRTPDTGGSGEPAEHPLISRLRGLVELADEGRLKEAREAALALRVEVLDDPQVLVPQIQALLSRILEEREGLYAQTVIRRVSYVALTLPSEHTLSLMTEALAPWALPLAETEAARWKKADGVEYDRPAWHAAEGTPAEYLVAGFAYILWVHWITPELREIGLFGDTVALVESIADTHRADPVLSILLRSLANLRRSLSADGRAEIEQACRVWLAAPQFSERLRVQIRLMLSDQLSAEADILAALRECKTHSEATALIRRWLNEDPQIKGDFSGLLDALLEAGLSGAHVHTALRNALTNSKQSETRSGVEGIMRSLSNLEDPSPAKTTACLTVFGQVAFWHQATQKDWDATYAFASDPETSRDLLRRWIERVITPHDAKRRVEQSGNTHCMGVTILNSNLPLNERLQLLVDFLERTETAGPHAQSLILQRLAWMDVNDLILHQPLVLNALRALLTARHTPDTTPAGIRDAATAAMSIIARSEYLLRVFGYPPVHADITEQLLNRAQDMGNEQDEDLRAVAEERFLALQEAGYFD